MADKSAARKTPRGASSIPGPAARNCSSTSKKKQAAAITKKGIEQFRGFFVLRIAGNLECRTRT
jgi:hypothetical protein